MPTTTPFDNLITFSRGSNATVTGSNGLIQYAPNNLLLQSESFDAAAWTKSNATTVINTTVAPDGTTTADKIVENTANAWHGVKQSAGTGVVGTFSFYAKAAERSRVWAAGDDPDFTVAVAVFNLSNGTVQSGAGTIIDVGNGWYRCSINATISARGCTVALANDAGTVIRVGDGTSGVFLWGTQLEIGSAATAYNPTTVKNLLGFSEAFDNAAWTKGGASIVTGAQANPVNGLFNAQKLMEDTSTSTHLVLPTSFPAVTSGQPYTFSVYAKAAGRTRVYLRDNATSNVGATFDLSAGTVAATEASVISASIINVGSGWYRCRVTYAAGAASANAQIRLVNTGTTTSYTGDGNSGVYIYGAQLSDSASLDPYVPTPGAAPSSTAFYGPRFDFDPVTLQPRGLLVEEQRTNLLLNSVFGGAVSGTPGTAPTSWGSFTNGSIVVTSLGRNFAANSIRVTTTSARHFYSQTVALAATGTWIITFKVNVGTAVRIDELLAFNTRPAGSTIQYFYNDAAQAASFVPPTGNGVLQVTVTTTGTSGNAEIRFGCGASNAVTADVTFWDAQWELGAFATSYIPTVASTVTRSADVATITGQNFGQWFGPTAGTFVAEVGRFSSVNTTGFATFLAATDNPISNDWIYIIGDGNVTVANYTNTGVAQANLSIATPITSGGKATFAYAANDFAASINGGAALTDTTGALTTDITIFRIGAFAANPNYTNGYIRNIRFIPARAADFQLQALST